MNQIIRPSGNEHVVVPIRDHFCSGVHRIRHSREPLHPCLSGGSTERDVKLATDQDENNPPAEIYS